MQSSDNKLEEIVTASNMMDAESTKRPAADIMSSAESKRPKLANGGSEDNGSHAKLSSPSEAPEALSDKEGQSEGASNVDTDVKISSVAETATSKSNDANSPKKVSLAGTQAETSVVVISEADDEEEASADDDEDDNDEDEEDDDDDDDCQIVGVSHRVPAMPRSDIEYVQHLRDRGLNPRDLLTSLIGSDMSGFQAPEEALWQLLLRLVSEPAQRKRLDGVSTLDDVVVLLSTCQRVLVLTGAGVSVSCGIPDFRSRDGIYARLATEYPELPDPHSMFDIHYFRQDQRPFFKFAKEIYPGQFKPSPSHRFIRALEERGRLLRNYSQNIDTLERAAGIQRVLNCHGSFATASCMRCKHSVESNTIKDDIMNERIPMCPKCSTTVEPSSEQSSRPSASTSAGPSASTSASTSAAAVEATELPAVLKPDIVFFGESLPVEFYDCISQDEGQADLLIVIGSSLKVQPVSLIPNSLPNRVPQILINREPLHQHNFDVCLLGDCDRIVAELCRRLGWDSVSDDAAAAAADDGEGLREIRGEELLDRRRLAYAEEQRQKAAAAYAAGSANAADSANAAGSANAADAANSTDSTNAAASASTSSSAAVADVPAAAAADNAGPSSCSSSAAGAGSGEEAAASATPHEDDCNLSAYLPPGTFARFMPNKYVFPGAEAHPDEICSDEDEADDYDDEEEEEEGDEGEEFDDEEDDDELSDYDEAASPVVVNLVSSDDEVIIEEEADEVEEQPAIDDDDDEAEDAESASTVRKPSPPTESTEPQIVPASVPASLPASAPAGGGKEIDDAEEDELLNCDVD